MPSATPQHDPTPIVVLIPTHTPRYLGVVLAALAKQSRRPDHVVVSCDTDDAAIGDVVKAMAAQTGLALSWVRRAHMGGERLCQTRNNGVRHIVDVLRIANGRLLTLDGDMLAPQGLVQAHAELGRSADLVYPYRINVDRERSEALDAQRILAEGVSFSPTPSEMEAIRERDARYRRHLLMRRLRLGPAHKPKLLGGHFSCDLALYVKLNGFDEHYQGWGFKDDEFAYRAARMGATVRVAVAAIPAFHLWHTTRQPDRPMRELPTARRFAERAKLPLVAENGVRNPLPQAAVQSTVYPELNPTTGIRVENASQLAPAGRSIA